jgi:hypothetical protein
VYKGGRVVYAFSTVTSFSVTCYRAGGGGVRGIGFPRNVGKSGVSDEKEYNRCVKAVERKYQRPNVSDDEWSKYSLDKKHLLELTALEIKQNNDKTMLALALVFIGAVAGYIIAGATKGAAVGPKGALIGAIAGGLIGVGVKLAEWWFGDSQVQEKFELRAQQLAEKYPNAAARDVWDSTTESERNAAKERELDECARKYLNAN